MHKLMSKWMDAAMFAGVFHLQSEHYERMRPPSFFDHDRLNRLRLTRDREQEAATSSASIAVPSEDALFSDVDDCPRAAATENGNPTSK